MLALAIGGTWLAVAFGVGVIVGHSIRLADQDAAQPSGRHLVAVPTQDPR